MCHIGDKGVDLKPCPTIISTNEMIQIGSGMVAMTRAGTEVVEIFPACKGVRYNCDENERSNMLMQKYFKRGEEGENTVGRSHGSCRSLGHLLHNATSCTTPPSKFEIL